MRELKDLRPCALRVIVVCPHIAFTRIVPPPGPAWRQAVRQHLAEWLEHDLAEALAGLPVGVHVIVRDAGPPDVSVFYYDDVATRSGEPDGARDLAAADALASASVRIVNIRYPSALRRAKRQADADRAGACPDCQAGRPVAAADLRPGDRYRPVDAPTQAWRDVASADPATGLVLADDGSGRTLYAVDAAETVFLRDPWCGC